MPETAPADNGHANSAEVAGQASVGEKEMRFDRPTRFSIVCDVFLRPPVRGRAAFEIGFPRRGVCVAAALLPLSLSAGCQQPLAVHDPYFEPGKTTPVALGAEAARVVRFHRALQAARSSCPDRAPAGNGRTDGPGDERAPAAAADRAALAAVCADMRAPSTAARGETSAAYRRWLEDRVRRLPKASATGAGAAGS